MTAEQFQIFLISQLKAQIQSLSLSLSLWWLQMLEEPRIISQLPSLINCPPDAFCTSPRTPLKGSHLASAAFCEESCLLITVWSCQRQQTGVFIRTANYRWVREMGCGKQHPASRGTQPAHTFVSTEASAAWHGRLVWLAIRFLGGSPPSIYQKRTRRRNDTTGRAAAVSQWQKCFSGSGLRPLNSAVFRFVSVHNPRLLLVYFTKICRGYFGELKASLGVCGRCNNMSRLQEFTWNSNTLLLWFFVFLTESKKQSSVTQRNFLLKISSLHL